MIKQVGLILMIIILSFMLFTDSQYNTQENIKIMHNIYVILFLLYYLYMTFDMVLPNTMEKIHNHINGFKIR